MDNEQMVFVAGFTFGVFFAGIAGWIWNHIQLARNAINMPNRPMIVPTHGTPRAVLNNAIIGFRRFIFWLIVLISFIVVSFILFYTFVIGNPVDLLILFS